MEHDDDRELERDPAWQLLSTIEGDAVPSDRMRRRLAATLESYRDNRSHRPGVFTRWQAGLAIAAVLLLGVLIGRESAPVPQPNPQLTALRAEVRELKEMTAMALLRQPSPSERLKGVSWTGEIDQPGQQVAGLLLDTLMRDPNSNVRLATIDALKRFADQESVRRGAIDALKYQSSPLVQIALIDFVTEVTGAQATDALRRVSSDTQLDGAVRARAAAMLRKVG